jgi:hypothetical protein
VIAADARLRADVLRIGDRVCELLAEVEAMSLLPLDVAGVRARRIIAAAREPRPIDALAA